MTRSSIHEKATILRDAVFGANDGIITTFAIVAGSTGASFSSKIVLILGFANLLADGLSMASGNYLGIKSEIDYEKASHTSTSGDRSPVKHGTVTFISFSSAGLLPLLPYVFGFSNAFGLSAVMVASSLFVIGCARSKYTQKNILRSGMEMLIIGGFAAVVAYLAGWGLDRYVV